MRRFKLPVQMSRKRYHTTLASPLTAARVELAKCFSFSLKCFYVMGRRLSGKLSCMWTGLILGLEALLSFVETPICKETFHAKPDIILYRVEIKNEPLNLLHSKRPKLYGILAILSAKGFKSRVTLANSKR